MLWRSALVRCLSVLSAVLSIATVCLAQRELAGQPTALNILANSAHESAAEQRLAAQLERRVTVHWQHQQLVVAVDRLARHQGLTIWLDRRIDPQQLIQLEATDEPLGQLLERLADQLQVGVSWVGEVIYLGPADAANALASLVQRARESLSRAEGIVGPSMLQSESSDWPRLTRPRELLSGLFQDARVPLVGTEQIPHDLWSERELPPLALIDRAVLVLVGFDLTCEMAPGGRACQILPIEHPVQVVRSYPFLRKQVNSLRSIRREIPHARLEVKGDRLTLTGRWEEHLLLRQRLSPNKLGKLSTDRGSTTEAQSVYSLRVENQPVGGVVDQLVRQLGLEVIWQGDADHEKLAREALISCDVENTDLDGLLQSVLAPAKLQFSRQGRRVEIERAR